MSFSGNAAKLEASLWAKLIYVIYHLLTDGTSFIAIAQTWILPDSFTSASIMFGNFMVHFSVRSTPCIAQQAPACWKENKARGSRPSL